MVPTKRLTITYTPYTNMPGMPGEETYDDVSYAAYGYGVYHFNWQGKYVMIPLKAIRKVVEENLDG